jgi:hypothetical protein
MTTLASALWPALSSAFRSTPYQVTVHLLALVGAWDVAVLAWWLVPAFVREVRGRYETAVVLVDRREPPRPGREDAR